MNTPTTLNKFLHKLTHLNRAPTKYGKALIIKTGNNTLSDIRKATTGKSVISERYYVRSATDPVRLEVTSTYTANQADNIRAAIASQSITELTKRYADYYSKMYSKVTTTDSLIITDNRDLNQLTVMETYEVEGLLVKDSLSGAHRGGFYANFVNEQLPDFAQARKHPLYLNYPFDLDYTIEVDLADGWNVAPESKEIARDEYRFKADISADDRTLSLHYQFAYLNDHLPAQKAARFASDLKEIKNNLSYNFSYKGDAIKNGTTNFWMVAFAMVLCLVFAYLAYRRYTMPSLVAPWDQPRALGRWLILPIIGLTASVIIAPFGIVGKGFFNASLWDSFVGTEFSTTYRAIILFEVAANFFLLACAVFSLVLIFKKRDIAPRVICASYLLSVVLLLSDSLLVKYVMQSNVDYSDVFRALVAACIWIPYFQKSTRVQETFVVPYPAIQPDLKAEDKPVEDELAEIT